LKGEITVQKFNIDTTKIEKTQHITTVVYDGDDVGAAKYIYQYLIDGFRKNAPVPLGNTDSHIMIEDVRMLIERGLLTNKSHYKITLKGEIVQ
jgi:hypothetical protein